MRPHSADALADEIIGLFLEKEREAHKHKGEITWKARRALRPPGVFQTRSRTTKTIARTTAFSSSSSFIVRRTIWIAPHGASDEAPSAAGLSVAAGIFIEPWPGSISPRCASVARSRQRRSRLHVAGPTPGMGVGVSAAWSVPLPLAALKGATQGALTP